MPDIRPAILDATLRLARRIETDPELREEYENWKKKKNAAAAARKEDEA